MRPSSALFLGQLVGDNTTPVLDAATYRGALLGMLQSVEAAQSGWSTCMCLPCTIRRTAASEPPQAAHTVSCRLDRVATPAAAGAAGNCFPQLAPSDVAGSNELRSVAAAGEAEEAEQPLLLLAAAATAAPASTPLDAARLAHAMATSLAFSQLLNSQQQGDLLMAQAERSGIGL